MEEKKPRWEVKYEHFVDKESSIKIERSLKQENIKLRQALNLFLTNAGI